MSNDLTWWRDALSGNRGPVHDDDMPARGWYRARLKGQPYVPVAIWYENKQLQCLWDGKLLDKHTACERWPHISKNPITYEVYQSVAERGEEWPDIDGEVANQLRGHNNPPTDPAKLLAEQIESAAAGIVDYDAISSNEHAARAQTLRSRMLELSGEADKQREALKRPVLEASKAIDAKWQPLIKKAKDVADKIRAALSVWETDKLNKSRAEAAKAQEEAVRAEAAGKPATPPPTPYMPAAIKGAAGRAASAKPRRVVTAVTNMDALYSCLKGRPEVAEMFMVLAQKIVDANQDVLGCRIEERVEIR